MLHHKGLSFAANVIDLRGGEHLADAYLALNPNGVIPTLVVGGKAIWDSTAIVEYLEDVHPEAPLRPDEPIERARMRAWCCYIDEVPTPATRVPSFHQYFAKNWAGASNAERRRHADRLPVRKEFFLKIGREGFAVAELDAAVEQLRNCMVRMERALEQTRWVVCDDYTLADVALTPTFVRMEDLGRASMWADLPSVSDWYARILALPNFGPTFAPPARELGRLAPPDTDTLGGHAS